MIPKLICFIFGHKINETQLLLNEILNEIKESALNHKQLNTNLICPRCGKKLV